MQSHTKMSSTSYPLLIYRKYQICLRPRLRMRMRRRYLKSWSSCKGRPWDCLVCQYINCRLPNLELNRIQEFRREKRNLRRSDKRYWLRSLSESNYLALIVHRDEDRPESIQDGRLRCMAWKGQLGYTGYILVINIRAKTIIQSVDP